MKLPNMCPFEKKEKEVFFRLPTFFFRNKKIFSKEQLLFSFLCIIMQKKNLDRMPSFPKIKDNRKKERAGQGWGTSPHPQILLD